MNHDLGAQPAVGGNSLEHAALGGDRRSRCYSSIESPSTGCRRHRAQRSGCIGEHRYHPHRAVDLGSSPASIHRLRFRHPAPLCCTLLTPASASADRFDKSNPVGFLPVAFGTSEVDPIGWTGKTAG